GFAVVAAYGKLTSAESPRGIDGVKAYVHSQPSSEDWHKVTDGSRVMMNGAGSISSIQLPTFTIAHLLTECNFDSTECGPVFWKSTMTNRETFAYYHKLSGRKLEPEWS